MIGNYQSGFGGDGQNPQIRAQRKQTAMMLHRVLTAPDEVINEYKGSMKRPGWVTRTVEAALEWLDEGSTEWRAVQFIADNPLLKIVRNGPGDAVERGLRMAENRITEAIR